MTNDNYSQITWADIRKGDVLMHENGDRLTVSAAGGHSGDVHVSGVWRMAEALGRYGYVPYRRKPEMPTKPGAYLDKEGDCWLLDRNGIWYDWSILDKPRINGGIPENYAPFTRLVPMPTEESVNSSIFKGFSGGQVSGVYIERATDAVMALLRGDR